MRNPKHTGISTMTSLTRTACVLLVAAALAAPSGCAVPDDIDRVQPDLIKKSDLTAGEWYYLPTIVQTPYASGRAFPGLQGTLERGIWEVERDYLFFYRTYEFVEGVESQGIKADTDAPLLDADGNPVTYEKTLPDGTTTTAIRYIYRSSPMLRYVISGHFDLRKDYNAATGEESHVFVEDDSEKYWYERDYMRVDFAKGISLAFGDAGSGGAAGFGSGVYEGQDGPEELSFRMKDDGGYMDFVLRQWYQGPQVWYGRWGYIPRCLFYAWYIGGYSECDVEEIHTRYAFKRVDEDNSYVGFDYNDQMLGKFGYYRASRANWDQYYGTTYSDAIRNIRRFRIWEDYVDADGDGMLDYEDMTPEPIVYYLSTEFPRELIGGALDLADQWNVPYVDLVQKLHDPEWSGRMYILCENNLDEVADVLAADPDAILAETDPTHCKGMDEPKYLGDLRYNLLVSINDPTQAGLYGYGPMHSDPTTGETIHANAFQYTANMRLGARNAVDMIEYAAGVQSFVDITQAQHITSTIKAKALQATERSPKSASMTVEDAMGVAAGVMPLETAANIEALGIELTDMDEARIGMNQILGNTDFDYLWRNADMAAIAGLPTDVLEDVPDVDGFLTDRVHPAHLSTEDILLANHQDVEALGQQAICMGDHFDDSFRGLALEYKSRYDKAVCEGLSGRDDLAFDYAVFNEPGAPCTDNTDGCTEDQVCMYFGQGDISSGKYCATPCSTKVLLDQLRKEIRRVNQISEFDYWDPNALYSDVKDERVHQSQQALRGLIETTREDVFLEVFDRIWSTVAMHEVGHNVGLRHNFASSTDALNYFDGYWDMKGYTNAEGDWFPKALWHADTEDQVAQRMREYQQTSIMEYTGAFNARYQGIGSYDRAAILFGYGELVNVFNAPPDYGKWSKQVAEPSDDDPSNYGIAERREAPMARALRKVHHTNLPELFGGVDNIQDRSLAHWSELVLEVDGEPVGCKLLDSPYDDGKCPEAGSFCTPFPTGYFCSDPTVTEVPFRFCSDEYNRFSPDCHTWDEGTDPFEIVRNSIDDYESYWPFRAYKRDSDTWSPQRSYWGRIMYDMSFWRKHFEHWAYDFARYNKGGWWAEKYGTPWHLDVNGGLGQTIAAKEIFTHLANVFGRPSDGWYAWNGARNRYEPVVNNGKYTYTNHFQVREDTGARPMYPRYDFSGYLYTPYRAGTFYDRLAALMYMTYPTMLFVRGADTNYDVRRFRLNFADVWPQRMQNILSGLVTSDPAPFGWCIEHEGIPPTEGGNGQPSRVKPRKWFGSAEELDDWYADCVPLTPEPEYTFPTTQYRLPALATIYGLAYLSRTYDRTYADRTRLWLEGEGTDIVIPDGFEIVTYHDPFSGKIYKSSYDPSEFDPYAPMTPRDTIPAADFEEHGHMVYPAAFLVAQADALLEPYKSNLSQLGDEYHYSDLQTTVGRMEIIRGLYRHMEFGF